MITAHLASGFIAQRLFAPDLRHALPVALTASILPDVDFFWHIFVDDFAFNHHRYWVHVPYFWLVVGLAVFPVARIYGLARYWMLFIGVIFLHLILDSFVGGIMWGAPFSDTLHSVTSVPETGQHWLVTNLTHWTVLAEVAIWLWAAALLVRRRRQPA